MLRAKAASGECLLLVRSSIHGLCTIMAARHKSPRMGVNGRCSKSCGYAVGASNWPSNFRSSDHHLVQGVRNLLWLNFQVPHAISNMAKDAKRVLSACRSLMETVRTYGQPWIWLRKNKGIENA